MFAAEKLGTELERLYRHRFSPEDRAERVRLWKTLCESFFARYVPPGATVLDLGAGYCDFINPIPAARKIAVDLNPETARSAAPGVETHAVDLSCLDEILEPDSVDVAFASNVFEHLGTREALFEVLGSVRRALKPGGRLLVMQPNVRAVGGAFWDFVDHSLPLTEKGMAEALRLSGLEVVESRARFLPYTTKCPLPQWPVLVRLYLRLRPAQWLLGKQMFVVGRRPES